MSLSTSNSRIEPVQARKPWHYYSRELLGAILTIALLELGLHVGVDKLSLSNLTPFKIEEGLSLRASTLDLAIEKAEKANVMNVSLIGSSMLNDIDPDELSKQLDNSPVEKFTLVGANSRGSALVLEEVVLPNLETNWVVYMVSPHDVNARSPVGERNESIPGIDSYAENRFVYKLSRAIETNLYLFKYRRPIVQLLPSIGSTRELIERLISPPTQEPAAAPAYEFSTYTEFETAARFEGDLARIYQLSKDSGARLAILAVPTNPSPEVTYEAFQQGAEAWMQSVETFAAERDIVVVNGFDLLDQPSQYRDTHHLSPSGADIVMPALAEAIRAVK